MPAKKKSPKQGASNKALTKATPAATELALFDRVADILDQARANVVRAVNSNMVLAYWLIGREIVQEIQGGKEREAYGEKVIKEFSQRLDARYGAGFSVTSLKYFRTFYQAYEDRLVPNGRPMGDQFTKSILPPKSRPTGAELALTEKRHPLGAESLVGFSPQLNWSHYRALMRVEKPKARNFYVSQLFTSPRLVANVD